MSAVMTTSERSSGIGPSSSAFRNDAPFTAAITPRFDHPKMVTNCEMKKTTTI